MSEQSSPSREPVNIPPVTAFAGDRAGLRRISPKDRIDVARMMEIELSKGMSDWIAEDEDINKNKRDLKQWVADMNRKDTTEFFAVTATKEIDPSNHGEIEGWLRIDGASGEDRMEETNRYQRIMGATLPKGSPSPVEITYIKRPHSPPDLMTGAIVEACHKVAAMDALLDRDMQPGAPLPQRRVIMAFSEAKNTKSVEVLEKAGFECVKEAVSWEPDWEPEHNMYVLNWNKHDQLMRQKEALLLDRLQQWLPEKFPQPPAVISSQPKSPGDRPLPASAK